MIKIKLKKYILCVGFGCLVAQLTMRETIQYVLKRRKYLGISVVYGRKRVLLDQYRDISDDYEDIQ